MAESLRDYVLANGGATILLENSSPYTAENGYAVGVATGTYFRVPVATATAEQLGALVNNIKDIIHLGGTILDEANAVGFWVNDGWIHIDPVQIVPSGRDAINLGYERKQEAIYDFRRKSEIFLPR
jgi:hypothetical protein